MIPEEIILSRPCGALRPYVRYYWIFRSGRQLNTLTFPIGCPQLIFHKGKPLYIPELDTTQDRLTISGQVNFSSHLYADGNTEMIVAVFHPHTLPIFLNTPMSIFYNQEVSGYGLEDMGLNCLAESIFGCKDNSICIRMIEEWLLSRLASCRYDAAYNVRRIGASVQRMHIAPQTPVTELSSIACLSKKQFERQFDSLVGINPKEYARLVRFRKALVQMQHHKEANMAQIAFCCGYADQSHFIREFKRFSGYTPAALLKKAEPYSDLFSDPV